MKRSAPRSLRRATALWVFASVTASALAARAEPAPDPSLHIWFRTSEGCPDGTSFLERLRGLGRQATLAGLGDRIDFVVTLAAQPSESAGRLERQTERGTVAIRELHAARCEDVAEGIALSLDLALQPTPESSPPSPDGAATPALPTASALPAPRDQRQEPEPFEPHPGPRPAAFVSRWGAQASLATGLVPFVLPGGGLFAELAARDGTASARLSARAAYGRGEVAQTDLHLTLFAARVDGCALGWQGAGWSVKPCLAADIGAERASTSGVEGSSDQGLWLSAAGLVRASVPLSKSIGLEAQLGAVIPIVRYGLGTPAGDDLFRTEPVGVEISVGAHWSP